MNADPRVIKALDRLEQIRRLRRAWWSYELNNYRAHLGIRQGKDADKAEAIVKALCEMPTASGIEAGATRCQAMLAAVKFMEGFAKRMVEGAAKRHGRGRWEKDVAAVTREAAEDLRTAAAEQLLG